MTEIVSTEKPITAPPDNLTVPQFFDLLRPSRTEHGHEPPSLIEDETGKAVTLTEVCSCVDFIDLLASYDSVLLSFRSKLALPPYPKF